MAALLCAWIVLALSRQVGEAADASNRAKQLVAGQPGPDEPDPDPQRGADPDPAAGLHRDPGPGPRPGRTRREAVQPGGRCAVPGPRCPGQRVGRPRGGAGPDEPARRLARPALRTRPLDQRGRNPPFTRPRDHSPDRPIGGCVRMERGGGVRTRTSATRRGPDGRRRGGVGGRTSPSASGGPSARTTATTAMPGRTSATTRLGRGPIAGVRMAWPGSPTIASSCASR